MDNTTKYLLIQEAKIEDLTRSMKIMIPNIVSTVSSGNINRMKTLEKRLPQHRDIRFIEQEAIRTIPNFKDNYQIALREIEKSSEFDKYTGKVAALGVALVASISKKYKVKEVYKLGIKQLHQVNFIPIPTGWIMPLIRLAVFITLITSIIVTGGAIILPIFKTIASVITLLFNTIAKIINIIIVVATNPDVTFKSVIVDYLKGQKEEIVDVVKDEIKSAPKEWWDSITDKFHELFPTDIPHDVSTYIYRKTDPLKLGRF